MINRETEGAHFTVCFNIDRRIVACQLAELARNARNH